MMVPIYIIDGGVWDGQFAFNPWNDARQHHYEASVPDGSRLVGVYGDTRLVTPQGGQLKASQVVLYGRLGVEGFDNKIPRSHHANRY